MFTGFFLLIGSFLANAALAEEAPLNPDATVDSNLQTDAFRTFAGFNEISAGGLVATVISAVLGLLGVIFIVLMVYAGFLWMTARGNEDQVKKAVGIIQTAIIGLIIVIAAYSITYFVFNALGGSLGGPELG